MDLKQKQKQYYMDNRDKIIQRNKQYYYDNKVERQRYNNEYWALHGHKYIYTNVMKILSIKYIILSTI